MQEKKIETEISQLTNSIAVNFFDSIKYVIDEWVPEKGSKCSWNLVLTSDPPGVRFGLELSSFGSCLILRALATPPFCKEGGSSGTMPGGIGTLFSSSFASSACNTHLILDSVFFITRLLRFPLTHSNKYVVSNIVARLNYMTKTFTLYYSSQSFLICWNVTQNFVKVSGSHAMTLNRLTV